MGDGGNPAGEPALMKHIPEGVIQVPESPDAPEALPGCRS
ncbi:antirestriction protein, partial [Escherichia coli]|nr:antirestriction protein [Escherichia coli]